jgi:hypothetical protein
MMVDLKVMAYFKISLSTRNWDRAIRKASLAEAFLLRHSQGLRGSVFCFKEVAIEHVKVGRAPAEVACPLHGACLRVVVFADGARSRPSLGGQLMVRWP